MGGEIREEAESTDGPERCDEQCQQHRWTPGTRSAFLQARDRQFVPDVTAETEEQPRRRGKRKYGYSGEGHPPSEAVANERCQGKTECDGHGCPTIDDRQRTSAFVGGHKCPSQGVVVLHL